MSFDRGDFFACAPGKGKSGCDAADRGLMG